VKQDRRRKHEISRDANVLPLESTPASCLVIPYLMVMFKWFVSCHIYCSL